MVQTGFEFHTLITVVSLRLESGGTCATKCGLAKWATARGSGARLAPATCETPLAWAALVAWTIEKVRTATVKNGRIPSHAA
jgi:hypothetical protein